MDIGVGDAEGLFLLSFLASTGVGLTLSLEWDSVLMPQGYGTGWNWTMDRPYKRWFYHLCLLAGSKRVTLIGRLPWHRHNGLRMHDVIKDVR